MRIYEIIEKKRDRYELSYEEIEFFINGYVNGLIPDYQAAALLMAIYINGMSERETYDLTQIMLDSGDKADLSGIPGIKVDKHSTGGIGDKTTLIIAPVVAACGVPVAKMSGRGLGHTGGTIDKFESIPGFRTQLKVDELINNVKKIGIAIAGQTGNLAPADKKLYSLRDVTATVSNLSLIASSIMSKKLASGADCIVLDVKKGSGAFMKTTEEAIRLAEAMVDIGWRADKKVAAVITDMNAPLGYAIGNSIEVMEAIDVLKGKGPDDLTEVSLFLAAKMLELAGLGDNSQCRLLAEAAVSSGKALAKFTELVRMQGGNPEVIDNTELFGNPKYSVQITVENEGYIDSIKADQIGRASVVSGAGRETKESSIDYTAGIYFYLKPGMKVRKGDTAATVHTNRPEKIEEAVTYIKNSFSIKPCSTPEHRLIYAVVDKNGVNYLK